MTTTPHDGLARLAYTLVRAAIARPKRALLLPLLAVLAAAGGLTRLELRTDGHALVPRDHSTVRFDAEVRERYGLRDPVVVLFETDHPDGVYNPATLAAVQAASDALAAIEEIGERQVTSLATERRDRVFPGTLTFRTFLEPPPTTPELLATVREDVEATGIAIGTLVSEDRTATAVLAGVPRAGETGGGRETGEAGGDRRRLLQRIRRTVEPLAAPGDRVWVAGAPVAESLLGEHILADLSLLVPLSMAVIAGILWLGCRRPWGVLLALAEIGACLVFTFGLMGWLGSPVYLTTAVLPVILVTIGLADEIHVFWHYQRRLAADEGAAGGSESRAEAVAGAMAEMAAPVSLTSVTTAAAFLSFLASSIAPVRWFGVFAAVGVIFCWLWTLTAIPAALVLLPRSRLRHPRPGGPRRRGERLGRWLAPWLARPRRTLGVLSLLTALAAFGLGRLYVQDSWLDGFAAGSPLRRATAVVNDKLHGSHLLLLEVAFEPARGAVTAAAGDREAPLLASENLELLGELEAFVRHRPEVGGVLGPHSQVSAVSYLWLGRRESQRRIPDHPSRVDRTLHRFRQGRGEHRLREVIDETLHRAVVTVYLEDANYLETRRLMRAIRGWADERLTPAGATLRFAGDVAVSQVMIPAIVHTQATSLALALLGAVAMVSLLYRSLAAGMLVALPTVTAVAWVAGAMGWLGIPLGVATSMFCAITLGIGVDYAIHLFERHRQLAAGAAGDTGPAGGSALAAVRVAGPAIVADAAAIALGFGLLALSRVPANARLGLLVAAALSAAAVLTLGGLGSVLAVRRSRPG